MVALKLAFRNLVGAGLRTWLNVFVLSLSFVVIIWQNGLIEGWNVQARRDMIDWEIGGGQYWHDTYDPYDPFTLQDSHGPIPGELISGMKAQELAPVLITQASFYPEGRIMSVLLKGIDPDQDILKLPATALKGNENDDVIPVMIGTRMARNNRLDVGSTITIRWRDANGTFDAAEAGIVQIFKTNVPAIDNGQMWLPLNRLQEMLQLPGEATMLVLKPGDHAVTNIQGWTFRNQQYLLSDIDAIIRQKSIGGSILYVILLALALLAIFDTQVLSIFRRRREIGTHMALGMTRFQVVQLFTLEGAMHGILAAIVAALYGIPLLSIQAVQGFSMPQGADDYGLAIAEKIFPAYSTGLILGTTAVVLVVTTIVSFMPARKIANMTPTDAIRGKLQ